MQTGTIVVDELKKQAKEEGYVAFVFPREDLQLYLVYLLGVMLGWVMATRTQ
jgi:hypothetical protein